MNKTRLERVFFFMTIKKSLLLQSVCHNVDFVGTEASTNYATCSINKSTKY